jgi:SAM-dependent methyltransferase
MTSQRDTGARLGAMVIPHISGAVRRFLDIDCGRGSLGAALKARRHISAYGLEADEGHARVARGVLDGVVAGFDPDGRLPFPVEYFDCIYLGAREHIADALPMFDKLLPYLEANGSFLLLLRNPGYWRQRTSGACAPHADPAAALEHLGLVTYLSEPLEDPRISDYPYSGPGEVRLDGRAFFVQHETEHRDLFLVGTLFHVTRVDYNPLIHAQALCVHGRVLSAYQVLSRIPAVYADEAQVAAAIAAEKQLCLLALAQHVDETKRLSRFAWAQYHFYEAVSRVPGHPLAFECQERFWQLLGDPGMARRLRRIYQQLYPAEELLSETASPPSPAVFEFPERENGRIRRVLMVTRAQPDFGLDVLYDGLTSVLGHSHVTEYPWKASLHGAAAEGLTSYPCMFNYPGAAHTAEDILARAAGGGFDVILYGAFDGSIGTDFLGALAAATPRTPWALVDQRDEPDDGRPDVKRGLPAVQPVAYFKRECLECIAWDPTVFPLPFAYPDSLIPEEVNGARTRAVFWAGNPLAGLRTAYLNHIAATLDLVFREQYTQEQYRQALLESRIGLNFFGLGFDTVRYWELPAHGCLLMANRLPIRMPHNFVDGVSAVFFEDLVDLEEKLRYYMAHEAEADAIARAGHAHLLQFHTGAARARQLLGTLAALVEE